MLYHPEHTPVCGRGKIFNPWTGVLVRSQDVMISTDDRNRSTIFCLLLLLGHVTASEVGGRRRGRRSDDTDPLAAVVSALSQEVEQLTAQLSSHDSEIASLRTRLTAAEQPVAFSATYMTADHHGLGVGQTLKFDKVIYNAGNAYNPATGLFIAPTDGTYLFYGHMVHNGQEVHGSWLEADIYVGSRWLVRVAACCESLNSGSNMVTVHLQQGDRVWMQVSKGTALWGGGHSSFSGIRLTTH